MSGEYETEDLNGATVLLVSDPACLEVAEQILLRLRRLVEMEEQEEGS